jgi:hypothetical protein
MLSRSDVPEDLRRQANVTLRHYPTSEQLQWMIDDVSRCGTDFGPPWLSAE